MADPVFRSAYDFLAPSPDANYGSVLPFAYNREGSGAWVTEGSNPRLAMPEWLRSAMQGVVGLGESTQTGSLTPEALALLTTGSVGTGALMAPRGALASGAARVAGAKQLSKDELWDRYHTLLQQQIDLPPDRQVEMAGKVKMARHKWQNAPDSVDLSARAGGVPGFSVQQQQPQQPGFRVAKDMVF